MFKNAGTTLDWSLRRCFSTDFIDHREDELMRQSASYLNRYLHSHPRIKALSSHWLPFPPDDIPEHDARVLILLRNPLERSRSVYNFERNQIGDSAGIQKARSLSFKEYIKWRLAPGTGPVIKNFHTRFCSGDYFGTDMDKLFAKAIANLEATPLMGLIHRYTESMALFETGLCDDFPDIDLSWKIQNSSQGDTATVEERVEKLKEELGDSFSTLVEANQYDLDLLSYAENKLESALAKVPNLNTHIQSIQRRNSLLV